MHLYLLFVLGLVDSRHPATKNFVTKYWRP